MTKLFSGNCPECGHGFTHASEVTEHREKEEATPNPGDLTVCIACGAALTFDDDMILQSFTGDLPPMVLKVQDALRKIRR